MAPFYPLFLFALKVEVFSFGDVDSCLNLIPSGVYLQHPVLRVLPAPEPENLPQRRDENKNCMNTKRGQ